ncbi:sensor histidine kinase [Streptococcus fryi]
MMTMSLSLVTHLIVLLVYKQVSRIKVDWHWYILLPIFFTLLKGFLPFVYVVSYPIVLICLSNWWDPHKSWNLHLFYGVYAVFIQLFLTRFLLDSSTLFLPDGAKMSVVLFFIVELVILPLNTCFLHLVNVNFATLRSIFDYSYLRDLLLPLNILMSSGYLMLSGLLLVQGNVIDLSLSQRQLLVFLYLIVFLLMLFHLIRQLIAMAERALLEQKDKQLSDLASYSKHVESLYKEIRSFRHDYANILISLKLGIDERDMDMVQKVYDGVLASTGQKFQQAKYDIGRLMNIKDDAIKSVLSAKLLEAQSEGINIVLEVGEEIGKPNMDLLDFITVLTILCDNAIYEAKHTQSANVTIAYFQQGEAKVLIVENSTRDEVVNISKIFEDGYSTKGENRGIGLANVRQIADSDPKVTIQTSSRNHVFRQTLEMWD